jgi:hypothetical protein
MSQRKFFKDFTPGELKYLETQARNIGLRPPSYLQRREDGTYQFDEFSDAQRNAIFNTLDNPQVRKVTIQYDQEWNGVSRTDRQSLTTADLQPKFVEVTADKLNRGTLTAEDLAITPVDGVVLKPVALTADEAARIGIEGYKQIDLVASTATSRTPVVNVEATNALTRSGDHFRQVQKEASAETIAAGQVAFTPTERNNGLTVTSVRYDASNNVIIRDNQGNQRVLNRDEQEQFTRQKEALFAVVAEEENELRYFRSWAEERGLDQREIDFAFTSTTPDASGRSRPITNQDFQNHLDEYKAANGRLPFATPATELEQFGTVLNDESRTAQALRVSPSGGAAGDKLDSTGGADTAVTLSDAERARLASATELDRLKREAIAGGTPPIATPTTTPQTVPDRIESGQNARDDLLARNQIGNDPTTVTESAGGNNANVDVDIRAVQNNPLDEYESYTYGLALHVLDKTEYDLMAQNATKWRPQNTLIASAGRWSESSADDSYLKRQAGWEDNFYFDNLKMTQLQSPSVVGRGTNTVDLEFTIIEPYGLTLLDRLIRTASVLKQDSYMHLCYMIQIDFFDSVKGLLIEHRKYIPITLIGMNIKVSGKGSQYAISATPFHYKALMNTITTTPQHVDVLSGTLREVFSDDSAKDFDIGGGAAADAIRAEQERLAEASSGTSSSYTGTAGSGRVLPNAQDAGARVANAGASPNTKPYAVHSYVAMYNGWWKKMKELNVTDPNVEPQNIKVRFADEIIAKEKLTKPTNTVVGDGPMAKVDTKQGVAVPETKQFEGFSFKAGSNIIEVINTVMMSSEYIRKQVLVGNKNESQTGSKLGTVNWWKVLPQVKLNGFDNTLNRWSYSIIYFVVPYKIWNTKHPNLPKKSPRLANCVKQYNYLYTGDNRSVIDFQVEFDMLYFTTVAGLKQINIGNTNRQEHGSTDGAEQIKPSSIDSNDRGRNSNSVTPVVHNLVPQDARNAGNNLEQDPIAVALGTITDSIYSGANGEMLTVNMKIIGDPTLVKQDDLFINIGQYYDPARKNERSDGIKLADSHHGGATDQSLNNNAIVTDAGEVLAWVQVLVPPDIDENTGGLRLGASASSVNSFTGVYKIMEVQNEFSQGKFVQTLVLIRYQEQDQDKTYRDALSSDLNAQRISSAGADDQTNPARTSEARNDAATPVVVRESSQVATLSNGAAEEPNIVQPPTLSAVIPPTQFNLLDTGNLPESVIERTDLA